ncbi:MAG: HPr family phosphocarrier protein [Planctomycetes bacterium]|nr:HPr family phosphocarrier protein [Planctomycetota bacterium]
MKSERQVTIANEKGLHVRPATKFAQVAVRFRSRIEVVKDGATVNAKSSIDLLTLAAEPGSVLLIRADGDDAQAAVDALAGLVADRFGFRDD